MSELWFIVLQIGDSVEDPVYSGAFGRLLKDPLHPDGPSKYTPGRDAQWELLVASIAIRGGLRVSRPPATDRKQVDFLVSTPRRTVAVECKRVRSLKKLRDDVADARDQIKASGVPGWIVADLTLVTDEGKYIKALDRYVPDEVVRRGQLECGNRFAKDHIGMLAETCGGADVAYFQWHDCVLRPAAVHEDGREEPWCTFGFWNALPLKPDNNPCRAAVDEVKMVFDGALPQH